MSNGYSGFADGINSGVNLGRTLVSGIERKRQSEEERAKEDRNYQRELQRDKMQASRALNQQRQTLQMQQDFKNQELEQNAANLAQTLPMNQSLQRVISPELVGKEINTGIRQANGSTLPSRLGKSTAFENPKYQKAIGGLVKSNLLDNMLATDQANQVLQQKTDLDTKKNQLTNQLYALTAQGKEIPPALIEQANLWGVSVGDPLKLITQNNYRTDYQNRNFGNQNALTDKRAANAAARQQYGIAHRPAKTAKVSKQDQAFSNLSNAIKNLSDE